MAASDSPPVGVSHPTVDPRSNAASSTHGRAERCTCTDCAYTVQIDADLPPKCPDCGGALTRVKS